MNATPYGPRTPAFAPARVTRLAKPAAPQLRWSSEKAANGGVLVRVWDAPEGEELRLLNAARRLIQAAGLSASVVACKANRQGRTQFRVLVTSEAQEAARMQDAADKRAAALTAEQATLVQRSADAWAALSLAEREELRAEGLRGILPR